MLKNYCNYIGVYTNKKGLGEGYMPWYEFVLWTSAPSHEDQSNMTGVFRTILTSRDPFCDCESSWTFHVWFLVSDGPVAWLCCWLTGLGSLINSYWDQSIVNFFVSLIYLWCIRGLPRTPMLQILLECCAFLADCKPVKVISCIYIKRYIFQVTLSFLLIPMTDYFRFHCTCTNPDPEESIY